MYYKLTYTSFEGKKNVKCCYQQNDHLYVFIQHAKYKKYLKILAIDF